VRIVDALLLASGRARQRESEAAGEEPVWYHTRTITMSAQTEAETAAAVDPPEPVPTAATAPPEEGLRLEVAPESSRQDAEEDTAAEPPESAAAAAATASDTVMSPLAQLGAEVGELGMELAEGGGAGGDVDDASAAAAARSPPEGVPPGDEIMSPYTALGNEVEGLRADLDQEVESSPPSPPSSAPVSTERVCRVVCPPGVAAGEMIEVEVDGTAVQVEAPPGIQPGEQFEIVLGTVGEAERAVETTEGERRVEAENAAAEQAAVTKLRREKKAAKAAERSRLPVPPSRRGTPQSNSSSKPSSFADRQAQASAEKKLRLDAKRRLQMRTVTGASPSAAARAGSAERVSPSAFAERQAVLNAERAARLAQKQKAKAAAAVPSTLDSGPKVNLREFTARQDMHLEEQRERRKALQERRLKAEEVVLPKRTVNMAEFSARLEETNKQKRENLEAKRLQRQVRTVLTVRTAV
jgi:hypothetical protein